jgi:hypothetical protein
MTSVSLRLDGYGPSLRFWNIQLALWLAYGLALMLPWIGEYSIALMLPRKLIIAVTGILASALLREVYRRFAQPGASVGAAIGIAAVTSAIVGAIWSAITAVLLGSSIGEELHRLGALDGGVPRFGGAAYEMMVLFAWSLVYLAYTLTTDSKDGLLRRPPAAIPNRELVVSNDATRVLVTQPDEIDWVQAAGDYVRVHTGGRSVLLRGTMTRYETTLGASYVRIHRSTIVNVARVRELVARPNREYLVVLRDGTRLRASRSYADRLRAALKL